MADKGCQCMCPSDYFMYSQSAAAPRVPTYFWDDFSHDMSLGTCELRDKGEDARAKRREKARYGVICPSLIMPFGFADVQIFI